MQASTMGHIQNTEPFHDPGEWQRWDPKMERTRLSESAWRKLTAKKKTDVSVMQQRVNSPDVYLLNSGIGVSLTRLLTSCAASKESPSLDKPERMMPILQAFCKYKKHMEVLCMPNTSVLYGQLLCKQANKTNINYS